MGHLQVNNLSPAHASDVLIFLIWSVGAFGDGSGSGGSGRVGGRATREDERRRAGAGLIDTDRGGNPTTGHH